MQRQSTEGPGTPAVASTMQLLAVVYDAVDQPTASVSMYTRAASVLEAIYGSTPDMCLPLSAMGGMLMRRNECVTPKPSPPIPPIPSPHAHRLSVNLHPFLALTSPLETASTGTLRYPLRRNTNPSRRSCWVRDG